MRSYNNFKRTDLYDTLCKQENELKNVLDTFAVFNAFTGELALVKGDKLVKRSALAVEYLLTIYNSLRDFPLLVCCNETHPKTFEYLSMMLAVANVANDLEIILCTDFMPLNVGLDLPLLSIEKEVERVFGFIIELKERLEV